MCVHAHVYEFIWEVSVCVTVSVYTLMCMCESGMWFCVDVDMYVCMCIDFLLCLRDKSNVPYLYLV